MVTDSLEVLPVRSVYLFWVHKNSRCCTSFCAFDLNHIPWKDQRSWVSLARIGDHKANQPVNTEAIPLIGLGIWHWLKSKALFTGSWWIPIRICFIWRHGTANSWQKDCHALEWRHPISYGNGLKHSMKLTIEPLLTRPKKIWGSCHPQHLHSASVKFYWRGLSRNSQFLAHSNGFLLYLFIVVRAFDCRNHSLCASQLSFYADTLVSTQAWTCSTYDWPAVFIDCKTRISGVRHFWLQVRCWIALRWILGTQAKHQHNDLQFHIPPLARYGSLMFRSLTMSRINRSSILL